MASFDADCSQSFSCPTPHNSLKQFTTNGFMRVITRLTTYHTTTKISFQGIEPHARKFMKNVNLKYFLTNVDAGTSPFIQSGKNYRVSHHGY